MILAKPRIRPFPGGCWECIGNDLILVGRTPEEAYVDWFVARAQQIDISRRQPHLRVLHEASFLRAIVPVKRT